MTHDDRLKVWLAVLGAAGILIVVGVPVLCWAHLPAQVATHWSFGGAPNGSMPRAVALLLLGAVTALPIALSWPRSGRPTTRPAALLGCIGFVSAMLSAVAVTIVVANWDRADWTQAAHIPVQGDLAILLVPSLFGLLAFKLAQRAFPEPRSSHEGTSPLELAEGERVFWAGGASNGWLLLVTLGAAALGCVLLATGSLGAGAGALLTAGVLELFSRIRVTVNERFVTIHYGHLGWVRQRIRVSRIGRANSLEVVPMAHGGWGYRGSLTLFRRAAVVVRRGPGLSLIFDETRQLTITVDDASTAAKLLSGLVQRAEARAGHAALSSEGS